MFLFWESKDPHNGHSASICLLSSGPLLGAANTKRVRYTQSPQRT